MAEKKSIGRPKKFNPRYPKRGITVIGGSGGVPVVCGGGGRIQGGGEEESNIMARIHLHDLSSTNCAIKLIHFTTWVLYHQSCTINGLAIAHSSSIRFICDL